MNKTSFLLALIPLLLLNHGCEKRAMPRINEKDPISIFNQLWTGVNEKYSLFDYIPVDWDSVYVVYKNKIYMDMSDNLLFSVLNSMILELKDAHSYLVNCNGLAGKRSPRYNFKDGYPVNLDLNFINTNYLRQEQLNFFENNSVYCWIRNTNIGYLGYWYFFINTKDDDYIKMLDYFSTSDGLIIDIRGNGGGSSTIADMMMSHFINKKTLVLNTKFKKGVKRDSFSDWIPNYLYPRIPFFNKPIVILINRASYSTSDRMVMYAKSLNNVYLVGTKTGGGIGVSTSYILNNGWVYNISTTVDALSDKTVNADGHNPDFEVIATYCNDKDDVIEKAIEVIRKKSAN